MENNTTPHRPTHRAYAVTKHGERKFWREIGAVWAHGDGEGFSLKLDYLPLNDAEIVIRKPLPKAEADAGEGGAR
jgi:hypothetical protein